MLAFGRKVVLISVYCLLCVMVLLSQSNFSYATNPALYQAEVSASQTQQQWQREALQQVLVRITGQPDLIQQQTIRNELANAANYIKQFEALRTEQGPFVRVTLDAARIQQFLTQQQIPIWDGQRPELLFWVVVQEASEREFVRNGESIWLAALVESLDQQAIPYMLPLYDIEDVSLLNENDVWGGFWQPIEQASARYQPQQIVLLLIEMAGTLEQPSWRLTAIRQYDTTLVSDELTATTESELLSGYVNLLDQQLVQQYAILLDSQLEQQVELQINGAKNLSDIVNIERRLQALLGVTQVRITANKPEQLFVSLALQMSTAQLLQSLQFMPEFKQVVLETEPVFSEHFSPAMAYESAVLAVFDYIRQ